jgi:hypothetical protein
VPELWITTLYFNTTALGLPFLTGALLLLAAPPGALSAWRWRSAAAGAAVAVAGLLRLDFAVSVPALALIAGLRAPAQHVRCALGFVAVWGALAVAGLTWLGVSPGAVAVIARSLDGAPQTQWQSAMVLGAAILPLAIASPAVAVLLWRAGWPHLPIASWALIGLAAVPALSPMAALYSAKYLVPAFCLGLVAVAGWMAGSPRRAPSPGALALTAPASVAVAALVLLVVGLERQPSTGLLSLSRTPLMHWTHDGPRPFGAYMTLLRQLRAGTPRPGYITFNRALAGWIERAPADAVVVLVNPRRDPSWAAEDALLNAWTWGWPAAYLESAGWVLEAHSPLHHLTLAAPDGRRASIRGVTQPPDSLPDRGCAIVFSSADWRDSAERELDNLARHAAAAGCRPES